MKKLFYLFALMLFYSSLFAQGGELQFNQSKLLQGTLTITKKPRFLQNNGFTDSTYMFWDSVMVVVPTGKTLKVETVCLGSNTPNYNLNSSGGYSSLAYSFPSRLGICQKIWVTLDNSLVFNSDEINATNSGNPSLPLWLPSGSYTFVIIGLTGMNSNSSSPNTASIKLGKDIRLHYLISGIEFNIVP